MIKCLRHMGLVVKDIDSALHFYTKILGFKVLKDAQENGPFIETILNKPRVDVRTVKMKAGDDNALLELLYFNNTIDDSCPHIINQKGFSHMALTVFDVDKTYKDLRGHGIAFVSPPQISADGKAKVAFCRDPEGNLLEMVQELK